MDWSEVCLRFTVTTPNLQRIRVIVPSTFWDLRIEGRDVQLLAFRSGITSETRGVQTYPSVQHAT